MELNTLGELMRDEAEGAPPPSSTVEPLVAGALRRGRRSLIGRRVAAGVAGCAVLVAGAAVAGQIPGRSVEVVPAAPTTVAAEPKPKPTPMASGPVSAPTRSGADSPTVEEVLAFLQSQLPGDFRYSQLSDDREPLPGAIGGSFTLTDEAGRSWLGGGIDNDIKDLACVAAESCTRKPLAGGEILVMRTPDDWKKAGEGTWYYFHRPDGSWVWVGQDNAFDGNGPVTRPSLPLSDDEVFALLTAPGWDPLVARCAAAGDAC